MVNGLCICGGEKMESLNNISKIEDAVYKLQDVIESMAYEIAAYRYPNRYSHIEDVGDILREYKVDKILKEIENL